MAMPIGPSSTAWTERLCCGSRGLPWCVIAEDGVEDGEELAHAGGDGDLGWPAAPDQASVESLQRGIAADGGQGRHVQGGADAGAAAHDHATAAEAAAVAVDRRDPDQGGDLAAIEGAELLSLIHISEPTRRTPIS